MAEITLEIKDVSKSFELPHEKRQTLKSYFLNPFKRIAKDKFLALDNVSFQVEKGEFVGIVGRNGSGKSTLLKVLAGIYEPSKGKVNVYGHLVPFLELGVGFNPELTGRENIFLNGTILGMTTRFLKQKFNEIVDFAEIREFIDLPVKNYSSGMTLRLAFSIAVQTKADIYLLDEILAVGDESFQKKSQAKMHELINSGSTIVFVSHNLENVQKYSDRVIFMEKGNIKYDGAPLDALRAYKLSMMSPEEQQKFLQTEKNTQKVSTAK